VAADDHEVGALMTIPPPPVLWLLKPPPAEVTVVGSVTEFAEIAPEIVVAAAV
jgi:hypothetical protein